MFALKVHPCARKNAIAGEIGDALKLALTAPPVEGKANEACIAYLAEALGVSRAVVAIVSGETSRQKVVRVSGFAAEEIRRRLNKLVIG